MFNCHGCECAKEPGDSQLFEERRNDFVKFCEQFEARIRLFRLFGVLIGSRGVESCISKTSNGKQRKSNRFFADKKVFAGKKYEIRCELVQGLDKKCS